MSVTFLPERLGQGLLSAPAGVAAPVNAETAPMRVTYVLILRLLLLLAATAPGIARAGVALPEAQRPLSVGTLTLTPCQAQYDDYCGSFERPLDPAGRVPGRLRIGFEWYPRRDRAHPALGTIAAQEGGPGYSTTGSRDGYVRLFEPLREHRDLLLMDKRGTGRSGALECPSLQGAGLPSIAAYTACGAKLGPAAWFYSTAFAADDLAALMDALDLAKLDFYGDSYGTFVGQVFAVRHPDRLRTLVLDSAYPVRGLSPWFESEYQTAPRALGIVCRRSPSCASLSGDPVARLERLVRAVRAHPLVGEAPDQDGTMRPVTVDPPALFLLLDFAGNTPIVWRDFDAATRSYLDEGDGLPLLRLVAESVYGNALGGGPATDFSVGLAAAVQCADYPQLFDYADPPARRRERIAAGVAAERAVRPAVFAPFTVDEVLAAPYQPIPVETCQGWPAPPRGIVAGHPAEGLAFPTLPVLVINGEVDTITSPRDGRQAARLFSWPRLVLVDNAVHETAIGDGGYFVPPFGGDLARCAQPIVLRFIDSGGDPGDTRCAAETRPIRTVPAFHRLVEDTAPAHSLLDGTEARALRAASAAAEAVGDVVARYYLTASGHGAGLRGGSFVLRPTADGYRFALDGVRFVEDLAVSGMIVWDQERGTILARVRLTGAASGELSLTWNDRETDAACLIAGIVDGHPLNATRIAP